MTLRPWDDLVGNDHPDYPDGVPAAPVYGDGDSDRVPACRNHPMRDVWWFNDDVHSAAGRAATSAAARVCVACPVLAECGQFAEALRPRAGVWAGRLWVQDRRRLGATGKQSMRNLLPGVLPDPIPEVDPMHDPPKQARRWMDDI
jgi:hypothetical protein